MAQSKNTKRALLASVLSIVLCLAMLIGSTFAWFTDSVSTGKNRIVAGNLDIELYHGASLDKEVKDTTDLFVAENGEPIKWEPGVIAYENFKVVNEGTLALKYQLSMNIGDFNYVSDTDKSLKDVLKVAVVENGEFSGDRADAQNLTFTSLADFAKEGKLAVDGFDTYAVVIYWEPSANDNDYNLNNGKTVTKGDALYIDLGINLVATQDTVESDSFDEKYDEQATYPIINNAAFAQALKTATTGSTVGLSAGTYEFPGEAIPEGVTLSGSGTDSTIIVTGSNGYQVENANVTIKNVKIDGTAARNAGYGTGALTLKGDNATIENCIVSGGGTTTYGSSIAVGLGTGETAYVKDTSVSKGFRGIFLGSQQGSVVVDGCDIDATYPISVDGGGDFTVTVTNSKLHGWTSYSAITSASFTDTEFSKGTSGYDFIRPYADTTFTRCSFDSDFLIGAGKSGITITLTNCVKNGVTVTAENVQSLVLDMSGSDGTNLRSCTIIVNGDAVELN